MWLTIYVLLVQIFLHEVVSESATNLDKEGADLDRNAEGPAEATLLSSQLRQLQSDRACFEEADEVMRCFDTMSLFSDLCDGCVGRQIPSEADSCQSFNKTMCGVVSTCPCGLCRKGIANFLDCVFENLVGCNVGCQF